MDYIEKKLLKAKKEYIKAFKENVKALDLEIIADSPVDTGHFKSSWILKWFKPEEFKYTRINRVPYGLELWRYGKSKKGWGITGGDYVVNKHLGKLYKDFDNINRRYF
jgi:hypothetical protein